MDKEPIQISVSPRRESLLSRLLRTRELGILGALLLMVLGLAIFAPSFLTSDNLLNVTRNLSFVGMVAMGQILVIITGGIDLSVGSVWGMSAVVTTALLSSGWPMAAAIPAGLAAALTAGLFNGFCITRLRMPPFIPTLAMLSIARGLALVITRGRPIYDYGPQSQAYLSIGGGTFLGIPNPLIFFVVIALLTWVALGRTVWGRHVYAVGGNERTARLTGLNVDRLKLQVYALSALVAGLAGIVEASYLSSVTSNLATGRELNVIAATVIGGTNLSGGEGTVLGVVIGTVILEVLRNGLLLLGIDPYWQGVFVGSVIVVAVFIDQLRKATRRD